MRGRRILTAAGSVALAIGALAVGVGDSTATATQLSARPSSSCPSSPPTTTQTYFNYTARSAAGSDHTTKTYVTYITVGTDPADKTTFTLHVSGYFVTVGSKVQYADWPQRESVTLKDPNHHWSTTAPVIFYSEPSNAKTVSLYALETYRWCNYNSNASNNWQEWLEVNATDTHPFQPTRLWQTGYVDATPYYVNTTISGTFARLTDAVTAHVSATYKGTTIGAVRAVGSIVFVNNHYSKSASTFPKLPVASLTRAGKTDGFVIGSSHPSVTAPKAGVVTFTVPGVFRSSSLGKTVRAAVKGDELATSGFQRS